MAGNDSAARASSQAQPIRENFEPDAAVRRHARRTFVCRRDVFAGLLIPEDAEVAKDAEDAEVAKDAEARKGGGRSVRPPPRPLVGLGGCANQDGVKVQVAVDHHLEHLVLVALLGDHELCGAGALTGQGVGPVAVGDG